MNEIESRAQSHADAREWLKQTVILVSAELDAVKRKRLAKLRAAVEKAQQTGDELLTLVAEAPDLFKRPKSHTLWGVKFGWKKEKGRIDFADGDQVIKLIRKHYPELAETLIVTTERPSKEAMNNLQADQLKKIGVTVTADSDVAFIGSTDSDVDKIVNALLKGVDEEAANAR